MKTTIHLLKLLGSPFAGYEYRPYTGFSKMLYEIALKNKVVLSYLSKVSDDSMANALYRYHSKRLDVLLENLVRICGGLNELGFNYVVFKTLKPFREEIADVDILCLGDDVEYEEMVRAVAGLGLRLMERSLYSTTFEDARVRFVTELMIDLYREVSVGPLVYLDKRLLRNHVAETTVGGCRVRVLELSAELLVTIAHALIKEMEVKLIDYLTALHLVHVMNHRSLEAFESLVRKARLTYGARLFLSLAAQLHELAHGFVPSKLGEVLGVLGGMIDALKYFPVTEPPPYRLSGRLLSRIYLEKLRDPVFKSSIIRGLTWLRSRRSITRIAHLIHSRLSG
jgi:hypothetical protein